MLQELRITDNDSSSDHIRHPLPAIFLHLLSDSAQVLFQVASNLIGCRAEVIFQLYQEDPWKLNCMLMQEIGPVEQIVNFIAWGVKCLFQFHIELIIFDCIRILEFLQLIKFWDFIFKLADNFAIIYFFQAAFLFMLKEIISSIANFSGDIIHNHLNLIALTWEYIKLLSDFFQINIVNIINLFDQMLQNLTIFLHNWWIWNVINHLYEKCLHINLTNSRFKGPKRLILERKLIFRYWPLVLH